MAPVKRESDAPEDDHSGERQAGGDWKVTAPRWVLVMAIGVLVLALGWTLGRMQSNNDERLEVMSKYQNDSRWEMLIRHGEQLNDLQGKVSRHEAWLQKLAEMAEDVRVLRKIAEASKKKGGGYGL